MSVKITLPLLVINKQRITSIVADVINTQGHSNLKIYFKDAVYTVATTRNAYEPKVYKSISSILADVKKLGFKEFTVKNYVI